MDRRISSKSENRLVHRCKFLSERIITQHNSDFDKSVFYFEHKCLKKNKIITINHDCMHCNFYKNNHIDIKEEEIGKISELGFETPKNFYKRADLLGISVYELINNYIFIIDKETNCFHGAVCRDDIDRYMISHDSYSDSIILFDCLLFLNNLKALNYDFLEKILEGYNEN